MMFIDATVCVEECTCQILLITNLESAITHDYMKEVYVAHELPRPCSEGVASLNANFSFRVAAKFFWLFLQVADACFELRILHEIVFEDFLEKV